MRIGVDVLAIQSPYSAGRGIGRYARALLAQLLAADETNHYILYAYEDLDQSALPRSSRSEVRLLRRRPDLHEHNYQFVADRLARTNPDKLDWLLVLSPFETWQFYGVPAKPLNGLRVASVLYDLIPFLFQEVYLREPTVSAWFYGHLQRLRTHDLLLAISEASRDDALRMLALPDSRVVTVGTASDASFFRPAEGDENSVDQAIRHRIGINAPYLFCLGSGDPRKNLEGLFRAFALLPSEIRQSMELVVTCALTGDEYDRTVEQANRAGVADRLVLTGQVDDVSLRALYRGCVAFVFPSIYEGFGLPILEAMHCGTPVIAGANSAQPEVVGDGGLLVNVADPASLATAMETLIRDPQLACELSTRGRARASFFSWEAVARRVLSALSSRTENRRRTTTLGRPHLACFSPLPPARSGIADYTDRLVRHLGRDYRIDLYHEPGLVPDADLSGEDFACRTASQFRRFDGLGIYGDRLLYQMGNSHYHHGQYEFLMERPGVVVLHDFCLAGFHYGYEKLGCGGAGWLRHEIADSHPERIEEFDLHEAEWSREPGGLPEALARRGFTVNRRVLERARVVVFHSEWCRQRVQEDWPEFSHKVRVVPMGADPRPVSREEKDLARSTLGLGPEDRVFISVGILHPTKMNVESLEAFARVARRYSKARFVLAGRDLGGGEAEEAVRRLGLSDRVLFLGHCSPEVYARVIRAADAGICLRRPPTKGETSAALLDLLRHGRTAIVCDVGSFSEWPEGPVIRIPWRGQGDLDTLARAIELLSEDPDVCEERGQLALERVAQRHAWKKVARRYQSIIEGEEA